MVVYPNSVMYGMFNNKIHCQAEEDKNSIFSAVIVEIEKVEEETNSVKD